MCDIRNYKSRRAECYAELIINETRRLPVREKPQLESRSGNRGPEIFVNYTIEFIIVELHGHQDPAAFDLGTLDGGIPLPTLHCELERPSV